jgi:CubicO group peptidase (beta-lactamase class C family)
LLVSAAVEAAAGEPFLTFMRKQGFEPLGLRDTYAVSATEPRDPACSSPHRLISNISYADTEGLELKIAQPFYMSLRKS